MTPRRSFLDNQSVVVQFFLLLGLVGLCTLIFTMLGMWLVGPLYGISGADLLIRDVNENPDSIAGDPNKINALKVIQLVSSVGLFLVPALVFAYVKRPDGDYLQVRRVPRIFWILTSIVLMLCATPLVGWLYQLNLKLNLPSAPLMEMIRNAEDQAMALTKLFLKMPTPGDLWFNLLLIALLPAIAEELFFRGVVQKLVYEGTRNVHAAVWIASAIFSFMHFQFLGFLPRMFLGVVLGYLFAYSGNIWICIIGHVFNNGSQVVAAYLFQRGLIGYDIEDTTPAPVYVAVASAFLTAALFYFMYKRRYTQPVVATEIAPTASDRDDLPFV